ncbi:helix-turn-helix domain-containing protein [Acidimangrovimonas pyrenivorans]|uniref:Helix-turn-helix domain-containing protein n=1 Tax=Acidimangrovimonas pyrenivorans TaxID=2030798 RepID=A0ABV7AKX1_9RHOB
MIGRRTPPSTADEQKPKGFDDFELRLGDVMRGERATLGKSLLDVQRELKIKATYVAAIENCDVSAFETQGFVAGYVRSYARYLGMDPEWAYARFCAEANFSASPGLSVGTVGSSSKSASAKPAARPKKEYRDPLADPNATFVPRGQAMFSGIEPRAIGSLLVLVALIGAIGYGGWSVLQQVQRVQLAPVDQAPGAVADLDPLAGIATGAEDKTAQLSVPAADKIDRLHRPQALDVPVMVSRDGPIASIKPGSLGALSSAPEESGITMAAAAPEPAPQAAAAPAVAPAADQAQTQARAEPGQVKVVADAAPSVQIFAVRPAWVRVRAADGTVLFEKILDAGEHYTVPQTEEPATLRAGNSGSVYFTVNGKTYGPAAPGAHVVKKLALTAGNLTDKYALADPKADPALASYVAVAQAQQ